MRTLRARLLLLFLLLLAGLAFVFVGGTQRMLARGYEAVVQPLLQDYADRLAADIGSPPDVARAQALAARLPISIVIRGPQVNWSSEGAAPPPPRAGHGRPHLSRRSADGHTIEFGAERAPWRGTPRFTGWLPLAALLGLTTFAAWLLRRWLAPLQDIRAGARRYAAGAFGQPIPVRRDDELGELAREVNTMASSLDGMLQGQRGLLLAISHELRSPLTRARLHAELLDEGPTRDALVRELATMRDLVSDLLDSERLAAGDAALQREPADLGALARAAAARAAESRPGAAERLDLGGLAADLPAQPLDRARIALLLRNLIDNALRHGAGRVELASGREPDGAIWLTVRDHGTGVDAAQRRRLAEPFFRPDAARSRDDGGVGLGLHLCRRVAEAHGATLAFEDAAPGLRARLRWPAG